MRIRAILILGALIPSVLQGQTVLETPSGKHEVIGLRHWTIQQLQDSLRAHDTSLESHACAAVIRRELGFADASVIVYLSGFGRAEKYTEIMVVEPQDSARVQFLPNPRDSLPDEPRWQDIILLFASNGNLYNFVANYPQVLYSDQPPQELLARSPDSQRLRDLLSAHLSPEELALAAQTLLNDKNRRNEIAAAVILGSPKAWPVAQPALVQGIRSPYAVPSLLSTAFLRYLVTQAHMPLDWAVAGPSFRAILDGTNLFMYGSVARMLTEAPPDTAYGRRVLSGAGRIPLARLAAADSTVRADAHALLRALTAYDLPADPAVWRAVLHSE